MTESTLFSRSDIMKEQGISIVLGTYNRKRYLKYTISQVREEICSLGVPAEIIVIDGGSNDGSINWLVKQKDIITIIQHNRGIWRGQVIESLSWGTFMNIAFKCARGKFVCMISDDCALIPGAIKNGYDEFESRIRSGQKIGGLAFHWRNWPSNSRYFVIRVKGQVYVNHGIYLKEALEKVGFINEMDYKFYCADTDLSFRLVKAGYLVESTARSLIEHSQHINTKIRKINKGEGKERLRHDEQALQRNWSDFFGCDDYRSVTVYDVSESPQPNDWYARKVFRRAYYLEKCKHYFSHIWFNLRSLMTFS